MIQRVLSCAACLAVLFLAGCRGPRDGTPVRHDPLREVGVDYRGLVGHDAAAVRERVIFLDMTIARIPEAQLEHALGADRPRAQGAPQAVSAERARALVAAWQQDSVVEITSAPKLLALPGQKASMFIGETVRYGKTKAISNQEGSLEFSIEEDAHGPVDLGMRLAVLPHLSADGREVSLEMAGSWRELNQELAPEATAKMTAAEFETHVREHRFETRFETQSDAWVVLGNPAWIEIDSGRVLQVVLLHTIVIDGDVNRAQE